jgi:gamma-glutamyl-gamma-aminobutyrate hydrolase PuuD
MKTYYIPSGDWPMNIEPYHALMRKAGLVRSSLERAEVLVLPGGADIGMRPERDKTEFHLYQEWTMAKKPVIGICRGMQIMLHLNDTPLIDHIPDEVTKVMHTTITGDWKGQSSWHKTRLGLLTNSRHHQGFHANKIPLCWEVIDETEDGIIEAVTYKNQLGVQWHPEHLEMDGTPAQNWWLEKVKEIL